MTTIPSEIPLVNRKHELEELKNHLNKATQGQGNLLFIAGEAGVGKTRLVEELKTYAQSQGIQVLQGWSLYESLTPYMPFIEALRSANLDHLFSREEPPKVECVYLITDTGLLIKDVVREETKLDSIIFAGMLTVVGDFVKDSLSMLSGKERKESLDSLGYEKYRILIERGTNTNLAVILTGRENEFLINDMKEVLVNVEQQFGNVLKIWDGDDNSIKGIDELLKSLITSGKYDGIDYAKDEPHIKRNRLFENVLLGIERHSKVNPSLLCIEDLQWADPSTMALIHYVARNTRKCKLLILGTYRPEDVAVTKDGKAHHLIEAMQLMSREDLYQKIELERLEEGYMDEMLSSLLGETDFTDDLKKQLYMETEGNPFFIVSLLRMLIVEKTIEIKDEAWTLTTDLKAVNLPSKIYDVIERRLSRIKRKEREILEYAAIIGEEFTSDTLAKATHLKKIDLLKKFRTLEQNHKLIRSIDTKYKFDHGIIKEVIYNQIPEEMRMEYHTLIADTIETLSKDYLEEVVRNLAYHYYRGKNREKALPYLIKAAKGAKKEYLNEEAIGFYTQALELEGDIQERMEIFEAMGDIYFLIGDYDKSINSYESTLELAEMNNKRAEIKAKIGGIYYRKLEYDESLKICTEALDLVKGEECKEEALAIYYIGNVHWLGGELDRTLECYEKSLEIREKIGDQRGIGQCLHGIGVTHFWKEENDEALESYEKSMEISEKIGDLYSMASCLVNIGNVYSHIGDFDRALESYEKSLKISEKIGSQRVMTWAYFSIADAYLKKKDIKRALDFCNQTLNLSKMVDAKESVALSKCVLGMIHREQKDWIQSIENFKENIKILQERGYVWHLGNSYFEFGLMWKEKGDIEKAKEHLNKALDIYEKLKMEKHLEKVKATIEAL
jgi:predicted ATPase